MAQIKFPESVEANANANQSASQYIVDYASQSNGGFRMVQGADIALKMVNSIRKDLGCSPVLKEFSSNLGITRNVLVIPYLPAVTNNAVNAWKDLKKADGKTTENHSRKIAVAVRNTNEAIAMYGYFSLLIIQNPAIKRVIQPIASTFDLINDGTDVGIRASDVIQTHKMAKAAEASSSEILPEKRATEEVKQSISETKKYSLIRLVKAVSGAVSGILGLILLATGFALVPAIVLLAFSLITNVTAISSEFYKETRKFNLISL